MKNFFAFVRLTWCAFFLLYFSASAIAVGNQMRVLTLTPKFPLRKSGLELSRATRAGVFFDVVGRRSAIFGYEHRALEAWVYPLKLIDDFELSFGLQGYPLDFRGADTAVHIEARPEATTITYAHAAFTVRQIIFAPVDEQGIIMLLDVKSTLPLTVTVSFRPRLKLMWPAGLMTGNLGWNNEDHIYYITEESNQYVGIIGSPTGTDISLMPYQEEPRDVPARFRIDATSEALKSNFIPIVVAGSVKGRVTAKATYDRLLSSARTLYEKNVIYYEQLQNQTVDVRTPDRRFNDAFAWAKVGVDKGIATNPLLGTGLIAGFRTSGDSERPGFAWFFGRDALWTALALTSCGDFNSTRTALEFLKQFQRPDGKIPHEISQSASLIPWLTGYPYAWASADATPLYVITHADYWRASGDRAFLEANWESIREAYDFTADTDSDENGLIENTLVGHGWVEGGALYPPHEEIYMQGLWIEASSNLAEMAEAMNDAELAARARAAAERTRAAMEQTYWLGERGFYAYATKLPTSKPPTAEPGPNLAVRQARLNELASATLFDENTVLPAVPLWWGTMMDERAQSEIDHLGGSPIATDWGARLLANDSRLYDPLSYHYGSVWPLFTGWASMGAYRYGRPHVGYQALMANALLTYTSALGYVTELLSGDINAPFGRSSHHQVWSEAMVITPTLRGMLGIEARAGGRELHFAPQLPANWDGVEARGISAGNARYDLTLMRGRPVGSMSIKLTRRDANATGAAATSANPLRLILSPAFPLDAQVRAVTVQGRPVKFEMIPAGDIQRAVVRLEAAQATTEVVFSYQPGTDVYVEMEVPATGARSEGLRILRARADANSLRLVVEGLAGHSYALRVRSPHVLGSVAGATLNAGGGSDPQLLINFDGTSDTYVRREFVMPIQRARR